MDINPKVEPDIVADMTDMKAQVESGSMDAVYSSHNIEHLYAHRVPVALGEFHRVLKEGGMLLITLPDMQAVAKHIAEGNLDGALYESPLGDISPLDIMYGHRGSLAKGNEYMAHKMAFTARTLGIFLKDAGFSDIQVQRKKLNLWAVGHKHSGRKQEQERVTLHDPELGPTGLRDDLEMTPKIWKPLGLKRA